jgi:hypothetical protein
MAVSLKAPELSNSEELKESIHLAQSHGKWSSLRVFQVFIFSGFHNSL